MQFVICIQRGPLIHRQMPLTSEKSVSLTSRTLVTAAVRTDSSPSGRADHRNPAATAYEPVIASWVQKLAISGRFCTKLAITRCPVPPGAVHTPLRRTFCVEIRKAPG